MVTPHLSRKACSLAVSMLWQAPRRTQNHWHRRRRVVGKTGSDIHAAITWMSAFEGSVVVRREVPVSMCSFCFSSHEQHEASMQLKAMSTQGTAHLLRLCCGAHCLTRVLVCGGENGEPKAGDYPSDDWLFSDSREESICMVNDFHRGAAGPGHGVQAGITVVDQYGQTRGHEDLACWRQGYDGIFYRIFRCTWILFSSRWKGVSRRRAQYVQGPEKLVA